MAFFRGLKTNRLRQCLLSGVWFYVCDAGVFYLEVIVNKHCDSVYMKLFNGTLCFIFVAFPWYSHWTLCYLVWWIDVHDITIIQFQKSENLLNLWQSQWNCTDFFISFSRQAHKSTTLQFLTRRFQCKCLCESDRWWVSHVNATLPLHKAPFAERLGNHLCLEMVCCWLQNNSYFTLEDIKKPLWVLAH